jgi:hypothetical protein
MDEYQCIDARKGMIKTGTVTKPVLILEFSGIDDQSTAIKYFQCELTTKKNYSVPRQGDFAKLYRLTFGESPDDRFSRADRLLKHFIGQNFYCQTELVLDKKTKKLYQKVSEIKPLISIENDAWTASGTKLKKRRNSQNTLDKKLATTWQENGKNLAIFCQQLGNAKSLQPAKTLGLQPFSIPLNHPYQGNKTINTQRVIGEKNYKVWSPVEGESYADFEERFLEESLANIIRPDQSLG